MKKLLTSAAAAAMMAFALPMHAETATPATTDDPYVAYLFTYFTGNHGDEEAVRYAISEDGYNYKALNGNRPVIDSKKISVTGGVRDPHLLRGEDGAFYMVLTDMVSDRGPYQLDALGHTCPRPLQRSAGPETRMGSPDHLRPRGRQISGIFLPPVCQRARHNTLRICQR